MIVGVGVDVVDIDRFAATMERVPRLAERLFTTQERALGTGRLGTGRLGMQTLAGRFAAKEALAKALGAPGTLAWRDAEVVRGPHGEPQLSITGSVAARAAAVGARDIKLSISHDGAMAVAIVIAQSNDPSDGLSDGMSDGRSDGLSDGTSNTSG